MFYSASQDPETLGLEADAPCCLITHPMMLCPFGIELGNNSYLFKALH